MPFTNHDEPFFGSGDNNKDSVSSDIFLLVKSITNEIVEKSPRLVAEVESGTTDRAVLETAIIKVIDEKKYHFGLSRDEIIGRVFDYMFGYGPLQPFTDDEDISDIDGTRYNEFVIKKKGIRKRVSINFGDEDSFDKFCKLLAIRSGGILNENDTHCRVCDEKKRLRINLSVRPRNTTGPAISVRKHRLKSYTIDALVREGMLNDEIAAFLRRLARTGASVVFSGKGAAGKTTLLRAFINIRREMERLLIAESDTEVYPDKPFCLSQRTKKVNEGGRPVTLRDIVRDGLTMSLDGYVIGEIVGDEAYDAITAANTGHVFIATTHSEGAGDTLHRLLTLAKSANVEVEEATMKEMLGRGIDVIIYLRSFKVVEVLEVLGYDPGSDNFRFNRLYSFDVQSIDRHGALMGKFGKCNEPGERLKEKLGKEGLD